MTNLNGDSGELVELCEQALQDPKRDPIAEADGYRDSWPDGEADQRGLMAGEIAWLREAVRRLTAPSTDEIVELVAEAIKREFYACVDEGPPKGEGMIRVARAALTASNHAELSERVRVLEAGLEQNARALNAAIECIGFPTIREPRRYRWRRFLTFAEGQAALEANNNARALLTDGDV